MSTTIHYKKQFWLEELKGKLLKEKLIVTYLGEDMTSVEPPHLVGVVHDNNEDERIYIEEDIRYSYAPSKKHLFNYFSGRPVIGKYFDMEEIQKYDFFIWLSEADFQNLKEIQDIDLVIVNINNELNNE